MSLGIYLDYAASTPMDQRVVAVMSQALSMNGNPSSLHGYGRACRAAVDEARAEFALLLGVQPSTLTFMSGATEANVTGITGVFRGMTKDWKDGPFRVLASSMEHASVEAALRVLVEDYGVMVDRIPVQKNGVVDSVDVAAAITDSTIMVVCMWANNVLGSLQPIASIGDIVRKERVSRGEGGLPLVMMSDAVQAMRTENVRPGDVGIDMLTLSSHKMYGPKGVGVLWCRENLPFVPAIVGGGQESGRRSGTENVAAIVASGEAARILREERPKDIGHVRMLRDRFVCGIQQSITHAEVVGDGYSVPGIVYVNIGRKDGDVLSLKLDAEGIALSSGSACDAGKRGVSSALRAVQGGSTNGIRVSFGRGTTVDAIDKAVAMISSFAS